MKKNNEKLNEIKEILDNLKNENLSLIDFDNLQSLLSEIQNSLLEKEIITNELQIIRDDYINRISGMVKAIAICRRSGRDLQSAIDLIEDLSAMTSEELLICYRKTSVKFRDSFPSTFKNNYNQPMSVSSKKKIEALK